MHSSTKQSKHIISHHSSHHNLQGKYNNGFDGYNSYANPHRNTQSGYIKTHAYLCFVPTANMPANSPTKSIRMDRIISLSFIHTKTVIIHINRDIHRSQIRNKFIADMDIITVANIMAIRISTEARTISTEARTLRHPMM